MNTVYTFKLNPTATLQQPPPFSSTNSTSDLMCQSDQSQYPSPNFVCAPAATAHASVVGCFETTKVPPGDSLCGLSKPFIGGCLDLIPEKVTVFHHPKKGSRIESLGHRFSCFNFIASCVKNRSEIAAKHH